MPVTYKSKDCGKRANLLFPFATRPMRKAVVAYKKAHPASVERVADLRGLAAPSRVRRLGACKYVASLHDAHPDFRLPGKYSCSKKAKMCHGVCIPQKRKCHRK